jgi:hypothetical protein
VTVIDADPSQLGQQSRLADPRLPDDVQDARPPILQGADLPVDPLELSSSAYQSAIA